MANAQQLFQAYCNIMNPLMIDGVGYGGRSIGLNVLYKKIGFEFEFANTNKKNEDRYMYLYPQLKFQFSKKEKNSESNIYHYLTVGYNQFNAVKNSTFFGRSEFVTHPHYDSTETALTYDEYAINATTKSRFVQIGYEKVTKKKSSGVAYGKTAVTNSTGGIIGWIKSGKGSSYTSRYTRTFKLSLFAALPQWSSIKVDGYTSQSGKQDSNIIVKVEPTLKNILGWRVGYVWTSLKPLGFTFGFEMAMVPGVFTRPGVYGWDFPDDNIYIKVNLGISIANSSND